MPLLRFEAFQRDDWQHIQTIEISQEEKNKFMNYVAMHNPVHGFYRYKLDGIVYESCISYIMDYLNAKK